MKKDIYLKVILTIIAICLVWICMRGIEIGPSKLHASQISSLSPQEVVIVGIKFPSYKTPDSLPIKSVFPFSLSVEVENFPMIQSVEVIGGGSESWESQKCK